MNRTFRRVLLGCALLAVFAVGIVVGQNKFGQPQSVLHVVLVKWKADSTPEARQKAIDGIKDMAASVPGIKNVWLKATRIQAPSETLKYDAAFGIEFESAAAAEAYAKSPAHEKWYAIYTPVREESRSYQLTN